MDRVAILLANGMAEQGIPTELWLSKSDGPLARLISPNVMVRHVPTPKFGGRGSKLFMQIPALAQMLRQHAPKAVLSAGNQSNLSLALARRLAGISGTSIIQKITNPIVRPGMGKIRSYLRRLRFALTFRLGDACLTLSEADARDLRRSMPNIASRFRAVRNAYVSPKMLQRGGVRRLRVENAPCELLSVGRVAYQKDHESLLRALANLTDLNWRLRILGDGPLMPDLRNLAKHLAIASRITFEGFVPDPAPAYLASDILVLSSRWEGFPAVPLEAMASGCDVVTTDCSPGLSEIMRELGRNPVPVGDHAALAAAIAAAISDSETDASMRGVAARYSLVSSVEDHLRLIALISRECQIK